eukprot:maker-scaffold_16-snap-gene-0.42-mRNA-1 protein AED:0.00 eAED:0.00 QI:377/1/1/1/1/1/2/179/356
MCLTSSGKCNPFDKLCGNHGSCIENICVCNSGWTNSFDYNSHIYAGPGAEEIFNSLKKNRSKVSLDEFLDELFLSAPCTKHLAGWNIIQITGILISLFSLFLIWRIQQNRKKWEKYDTTKVTTIINTVITNSIRLKEQESMYPFSFAGSLGIALSFIFLQATIYFFFVKYTKYNLKKAKALYALRTTFYGYNVEKLFSFQIYFTFFLDVIAVGGCVLIQPILIEYTKNKEIFEFIVLDYLRYIQSIQNALISISSVIILVVCHIVMNAIEKDLRFLTTFYSTQKQLTNHEEIEHSDAIIKLLPRIKWIKFMTSQFYIGSLVIFFTFFVFPTSEVAFQYLGPIYSGIVIPLLSIILY